jgi:hypothetical protein
VASNRQDASPATPEHARRPEVHIEYEPRIPERCRPQSGQSGDVERFKDWVNTDPVAVLNPVGDFGLWEPELESPRGLRVVFDGGDTAVLREGDFKGKVESSYTSAKR